ncbi:hypothetical protein, variant [Capsaspora owczarzaki ATCC 30864]|nr:hypothetical protein, variant [Capsaspora owczarzaki ATCC 30864]
MLQTINRAVKRDWNFVSEEYIVDLLTYLLNKAAEVIQTPRSPRYIRNAFCTTIASVLRQGWLDESNPERARRHHQRLLDTLPSFLLSDQPQFRLLGAALSIAALEAFSIFKPPETIEYHHLRKREFEHTALLPMFAQTLDALHNSIMTLIGVISEFQQAPATNHPLMPALSSWLVVTSQLLNACCQIVSWQFTTEVMPRFDTTDNTQTMPLKPPAAWRPVFVSSLPPLAALEQQHSLLARGPETSWLVSFFFSMYDLLRPVAFSGLFSNFSELNSHLSDCTEMAHRCIEQLSSLHGPLLDQDGPAPGAPMALAKASYFQCYVQHLVNLTSGWLDDYRRVCQQQRQQQQHDMNHDRRGHRQRHVGVSAGDVGSIDLGDGGPLDRELTALTTTFKRLTNACGVVSMCNMLGNEQMLVRFAECMVALSCACMKPETKAIERSAADGLEELLTAWGPLLSHEAARDFWHPHAFQVFATFVESKMQSTNINSASDSKNDEDDDDDDDDDDLASLDDDEFDVDHAVFAELLQSVAQLGRHCILQAIELLTKCLHERLQMLDSWATQLPSVVANVQATQRADSSSAMLALVVKASRLPPGFNDQLHWLVLIAGCLIADPQGTGETPLIPREVMNASHHSSAVHGDDPVVGLISLVHELCNIESRVLTMELGFLPASLLSPELALTLVWWLNRWTATYLLLDERNYSTGGQHLSPAIVNAYGHDTPHEHIIPEMILGKISLNLVHWNSEPRVVRESVDLLQTFTTGRVTCAVALCSPAVADIVRNLCAEAALTEIALSPVYANLPLEAAQQQCVSLFNGNAFQRTSLTNLPSSTLTTLTNSLCEMGVSDIGSHAARSAAALVARYLSRPDADAAELELTRQRIIEGQELKLHQQRHTATLLDAVTSKFRSLVQHPHFTATAQLHPVRLAVEKHLECLCGIALLTPGNDATAELLASYLHELFPLLIELIALYSTCPEICTLVVSLFGGIAEKQIAMLSQRNSDRFLQAVVSMAETFFHYRMANTIAATRAGDMEETRHSDLLVLIKLFEDVLHREFLDLNSGLDAFGDSDGLVAEVHVHPEPGGIAATTVVLHGLRLLIPVVCRDLMLIPYIANGLFKLISFTLSFCAERLLQPEHAQDWELIVHAVTMGLASNHNDTVRYSFQAVFDLCRQSFKVASGDSPLQEPQQALDLSALPPHVPATLDAMLRATVENMVLKPFSYGHMDTAAESLLAAICCVPSSYQAFVHEIVESQRNIIDPTRLERLQEALLSLLFGFNKPTEKETLQAFRARCRQALPSARSVISR